MGKLMLLWLSISWLVIGCKHQSPSRSLEAEGVERVCLVPGSDGECPLTTAQILSAFQAQLDAGGASSSLGLTAAARAPLVSRIAGLLASQRNIAAADLFKSPDVAAATTAAGTSIDLLLGRSPVRGSNPIAAGLMQLRGAVPELVPVFVKPLQVELQAALREANNGYLDYQLTKLYRSWQLPGITFPDAEFLPPRTPAYGTVLDRRVDSALVVHHAFVEGQTLVPLAAVLRRGGGFVSRVTSEHDGSDTSFKLRPAVQQQLTESIQTASLLRYVMDDCDGHVYQYLVNFTLEGSEASSASLVAIDHGAAASSLTFGDADLPRASRSRRAQMDQESINLGGDYMVPMPSQLDGTLSRHLAQLRDTAGQQLELDPSGGDPSLDEAFRRQVMHNVQQVFERFDLSSAAAAGAADGRADAPDESQDDAQDKGPRSPSSGDDRRGHGVR